MNIQEATLFALDAYNRWDAPDDLGVPFGAEVIDQLVEGAFAAVAYYLPSTNEIVFAYRGTDDQLTDALTGWTIGSGWYNSPQSQADLAFGFFNDVRAAISDPSHDYNHAAGADIVLTGHSLGGGLAGLVASINHLPAFVFDSMPFTEAAGNLHSDIAGPDIDAYWKQLAFPDGVVQPPSFAEVKSASILNEILSGLRWGTPVQVATNPIVTSGIEAIVLQQNNIKAGTVTDPVDLHSPSLITIALHGGLQHGVYRQAGGDAIYKHLFDTTLATELGFADAGALLQFLAYTVDDEVTVLDSLFEDMDLLGEILHANTPNVFVDVLGKLAVVHTAHAAGAPDLTLRTGLIEHANGTANIALEGIFDRQEILNEFGQFLAVSVASALDTSALANVAVAWSGNGGDAYLQPGGTLFFGSEHADVIYGSDENDIIFSMGSNATYQDVIWGGGGKDVIYASVGTDTIRDGSGNDRVHGGAGNDVLHIGTGSDAIFGEANDDTFHIGEALEGDVDYVNGGAGAGDIVQLSVGAKFRLDAAGAAAIRGQVVADGFAAPTGHGVGIEMGVGDAFVQVVEIFKASAGVNEVVIGTTASLSGTGATSFDFTAGTTDTANFDGSERAVLSLTGEAGRSKAIQIGANTVGFFGIDVWNLSGKGDEVYVNQSHIGTQTVVVNAGEGYDRLDISGIVGPVTYHLDGTIGGTNIVATGFERVHTGAGNDTFHGGDIGEYWHAGGGTNTLMGSLGADTAISTGNLIVDYSASAGVVYLYRETGTSNASVVNGATSAGSQSMGSGDYLSATGWSRMTGSAGTDVLSVVGAYGTLISNGGDDRLIGWKNNDTFFGADGYYETITPGDGNDTIHFGSGGGTLDFSTSTRAAVIDMAAGKYLFGDQEDTVTGEYSKIIGTSFGDRIEGTGNGETIDGGAGSAYDVIYGHGGDDTITFGTGTVHGGEGIDTIKALRGNAIIFGEGGNDKIEGSSNALIYGGDGDDTISASSGSTIHGGDGVDTISAFTGSIIYGDDGNDILSTQSGATDVTIHGGAGGDTITFYAPSGYAKSTLSYSQSDAGVSLIRTGGGIVATGGHAQGDTLLGTFSVIGSAYADTFDLITSDTAWIKAGGGDDVITLRQSGGSAYGEAGDDTFTLTAHDQKAYGGLDNDTFHGHGKMYGEEGDDEFFLGYGEYYSGAGSYVTIKVGGTVYGGSGSNTIHGGLGNDSIHMFDGSDTFIYAAGGGHDMIYGAGADDHFVLDGVLGMQSLSDISANLFQDSDRTELRFAGKTQKIGFIGLTADQVLGLDWSFV